MVLTCPVTVAKNNVNFKKISGGTLAPPALCLCQRVHYIQRLIKYCIFTLWKTDLH